LSSPSDDGVYVLDTDASLTGLGAVLQQKQNEELKVIAYGSRCLSRSEQNYNTTRRELLAMICGFKQFRQFLLGKKFILRVDHSALVYLRRTRDLMGQAARWLEFIEEYDFDLVHLARTSHGNCDALSRFPYENETDVNRADESDCRRVHAAESRSPKAPVDLTPEVLAEKQRQDEVLKTIMEALLRMEQRPSWTDIQAAPEETRVLWAQ